MQGKRLDRVNQLIKEEISTLLQRELKDPRDLKLQRAVWHTYFEPMAKQEAVAERLGLPFSTYRHHLARAVDRIAATLWRREHARRAN